jgi:ubiquinone/menaquinone biosynthesis C-methylase UbiE
MNPNTNTWNRLRYGFYAPGYDLVGRRMDGARRRSVDLLALAPGERVLLVGAGTGLDLPYLPPGLEITAIDLSARMLARCEARARDLGVEMTCRVMDAHAMDLPDESFDAVLLHLVLSVVPDPYAAASEAGRVLRPGGRAGIFDKFLARGAKPSLARRLACAVSNVVFSDINRELEPLLEEARLEIAHDEPSYGRGMYRIVVARKAG